MRIFDLEYWREIISVLKANKFRSALTAFGVFWGIMMLVVMAGSGKGLENGVYHGFENLAKNSTFIWAEKTGEPYAGFERGRYWEITTDDIKNLQRQIPEILLVAPRIEAGEFESTNNITRKNKKGTFSIVGDHPNFARIDPTRIIYGRFLNELDLQEKRNTCVIGNNVYEQLFEKGENPIGEKIKVNGISFTVVGVTKPGADDEDGSKKKLIHLPLTTVQNLLNAGSRIDYFGVTAKPQVEVSGIENTIIKILKINHKISITDEQAVGHYNIEKQFKKMTNLFDGVKILTWIVGLGTLIAGVFGISNVMLLIVKERTKEIGIKRALGATPWNIKLQIINESVVLTTIAGYIGLTVGVMILEIFKYITDYMNTGSSDVFFKNPELSASIAVSALIILIISGALAGLLPAQKAIQIKPIEAIRDE